MKQEIDYLLDELNLVSAKVLDFRIWYEDFIVKIEIKFKLVGKDSGYLKVLFFDVQEYSFYWKSIYYFYNIVNFKLIKISDLYYISLDPDESIENISENDEDYIYFKTLEIYKSLDNVNYKKRG